MTGPVEQSTDSLEVVEPLGGATLVTVLVGEQRIKVQVPPDFAVAAGGNSGWNSAPTG